MRSHAQSLSGHHAKLRRSKHHCYRCKMNARGYSRVRAVARIPLARHYWSDTTIPRWREVGSWSLLSFTSNLHRAWIVCSPSRRNHDGPSARFANYEVLSAAFGWIGEWLRAGHRRAAGTIDVNTVWIGWIGWLLRLAPLVKPRHPNRGISACLPGHCISSVCTTPNGTPSRSYAALNSATR